MKKVLAVTALVGVAGVATIADAAPVAATLVSVISYSNNGSGSFNLSLSTATWTFDTATGEAVITGGTYYGEVLSPNVYGHTMNGVTLGNFSPTIGTWSCQEGTFGGAVGASICGNYNFGSNKINQSTYTPSAQGATVTLGGDDNVGGVPSQPSPGLLPQSMQSTYSNMTTTNLGGGLYLLSNALFPGSIASKAGYDFVFQTEPPPYPDAADDSFTTFKNTAIALPVMANDFGWTDTVTVALFNLPVHGTALVTGSPGAQSGIRINYTPAPGFTGTDSFQYVVDNGSVADIATVTVTVSEPDAVDDAASTGAQSPLTINALANDLGFVDPVTVGITIDPSHGAVVVNGSPGNKAGITFTYTPATGFTGTDTFDYAVDDGVNADSGTVTVTVRPTALPDSVQTDRNTAVTIPVLANDLGFGNPVTVTLPSSPVHGTAVVNGSPGPQGEVSITYTPAASYTGLDTFTYRVNDGVAQSTTTVIVRVKPQATNDQAVVITNTPKVIAVLNNDVGFMDPVTVAIFSIPAHGTVAVDNSPGKQSAITITYTPALDYQGPDSFAYTVADDTADGSGLGTATVTLVVSQDSDGDGAFDYQDNCRTIANADQRDTNGDGFGNLCDADLDNSGFVNFSDLSLFKQRFTTTDPDANLDGIGIVNFADLAIFKSLFGKPPGPSGSAP